MSRQRTRATELARLLHDVPRPVYVLDAERTIVFSNEACLEWIGRPAEEVLGQRLAYYSPTPGDAASACAGLCPPPSVEQGRPVTATVAVEYPAGRLRRRRARFVPLSDTDGRTIALVGLVDEEDLADDAPLVEVFDPAAAPPAPDAMHDWIRRFRTAAALRCRIDRLVGESPAARRARAQAEVAAACRASVQIVGPPGSGRQSVARAIHYAADPRHEGSLVPLDCSTLGSALIRSTISALASRRWGEGAAQSTVVLNEADRLPRDVQRELAGVFSSSSFAPRLVATVRRPLERLARRGRFDAALAAVLGTIVIHLPPLAERREDLPLLSQMLLEDVNARGAKQLGGFAPEALERLDGYPWPGNIDELALLIAEAHERAEGPEIQAADLPKRIHLAADAAAHPRSREEPIQLDAFLGQIERELIERALARAKGNKARAARLLGVTRPRLYRRMVQLGLEQGAG